MTDFSEHPDAMDIAGFVDRSLRPDARAAVEAHLAACDECRQEVLEVDRINRGVPGRRPALLPIGAALAAAAVLLMVLVPGRRVTPPEGMHREPAVSSTVVPRTVAPVGAVRALDSVRWSSVPGADRYSVTVFDARGAVLWQAGVTDTVIAVPSDVRLSGGEKYFWSVRARTGWDRWVGSALTEFSIMPAAP